MFDRHKTDLIDKICQIGGIFECGNEQMVELARLAIEKTIDRRYPDTASWDDVAGDLIEFYFPYGEVGSKAIKPTRMAINSH